VSQSKGRGEGESERSAYQEKKAWIPGRRSGGISCIVQEVSCRDGIHLVFQTTEVGTTSPSPRYRLHPDRQACGRSQENPNPRVDDTDLQISKLDVQKLTKVA